MLAQQLIFLSAILAVTYAVPTINSFEARADYPPPDGTMTIYSDYIQ